jgi:hypothetical protein
LIVRSLSLVRNSVSAPASKTVTRAEAPPTMKPPGPLNQLVIELPSNPPLALSVMVG